MLTQQSLAQTTPVANVEVKQISTTDTAAEKKAEAIKLAAENDKLFSTPLFEGKMGLSLFVEDTYSGKNIANTPQNSYSKGYILGNLYATKDLYLSANLRLATSSGEKTTQNYFFDEGSAFFAELAIRYDADDYSLVAGHTSINYSLSRDFAAGIWGKTIAKKEYGVDNMMVLGGAYKFDTPGYGNHALSGSAFMVDTTGLSDTFGASRNPTPLSLGGPANTGKLNNYAVSLDGLNIPIFPQFRYQLAAVKLTTQSLYNVDTNTPVANQYLGNEQRYVVSTLVNKIDLGGGIKLTPLLEYNRIINSAGLAGYNKSYYVGSLLFGYKQWSFGLSGNVWDANWNAEAPNIKKLIPSNVYVSDRWNQQQVAIGYTFENGIKTMVGYKKENQYIGTTSQTVGLNVKYDLPFAF
ncbi:MULTISPECIES: hypothetical protein [Polynucleobacter]|nr:MULTISPECIES: hypothetical protein [Polynucleobacter]MBU3552540.1 hypothetical protein [Polynucleobacter sp. MWH-Post4-6-1]